MHNSSLEGFILKGQVSILVHVQIPGNYNIHTKIFNIMYMCISFIYFNDNQISHIVLVFVAQLLYNTH